MKKIALFALLPTCLIGLISCGPSYPKETSRQNTAGDTLIKKNLYGYDPKENEVAYAGKLEVLFKKDGDVPYIGLKEGFRFLKTIKSARFDSKTYKTADYAYEEKVGKFVVTADNGSTASFDAAGKRIAFSDFHRFTELIRPTDTPLTIFHTANPIAVNEPSYTSGGSFTLDLSPYASLDIYKADGEYYLPLETFNDVFFNSNEYINIAYNLKDVFLVQSDALAKTGEDGKSVLTALGKKFYGGPKQEKVSASYAKYFYDSLVFDLSAFYGLKSDKGIADFDRYFEQKGYKQDLLSGDVQKMDSAFVYALTTLCDGHSSFTLSSPFYKFGALSPDPAKMDQTYLNWEKRRPALMKKRLEKGIVSRKEYYADAGVAYATFDEFTEINAKTLYKSTYSEAEVVADSNILFASLYRDLRDKAELKPIKTVVVDLSCNYGGASDSLAFILNTLVGSVSAPNYAYPTASSSSAKISADINLDGVVNENDKSLRELGYHIVFLNTDQSFSCGNALPCYAKANYPTVLNIGENSGGGACIMRPAMNALGASYSISGLKALGKTVDGEFVHFDKGVPAEIALSEGELFDRQAINAKLQSHFQGE